MSANAVNTVNECINIVVIVVIIIVIIRLHLDCSPCVYPHVQKSGLIFLTLSCGVVPCCFLHIHFVVVPAHALPSFPHTLVFPPLPVLPAFCLRAMLFLFFLTLFVCLLRFLSLSIHHFLFVPPSFFLCSCSYLFLISLLLVVLCSLSLIPRPYLFDSSLSGLTPQCLVLALL